MPKYSVQDVLEIIQTFTPDEKSQLQAQLPSILSLTTVPATPQKSQSQSFGNLSMGSGNAFGANQAGGDINSSQNNTQASVKNTSLQEALGILQKLKQDINQSNALNKLQKATIEGTIKVVEEEISKPNPDKSLIDQAVEALKSGLSLVNLVEPVTKIAELVAKVWCI
jgi:hypothetical protein